MLEVLRDRTYRHLFSAQIVALLGTGLATVALGLLAFELAGPDAGMVLGTALAIKMIAYIGVAPVVSAFAGRLPRRAFLVAMDLVRAAVALLLPFVDQVWQVYVLIFVLQSASAAFTPTFQATIPDILPEEGRYTRALSLSRLAYDTEALVSPLLAAALLTVISFNWLFAGTVIGFLLSAALVVSVRLPQPKAVERKGGIYDREGGDVACYSRQQDHIRMPARERFVGTPTSSPTEAYYATLLHELTHWTGAAHRLDRAFGTRFGDHAYAMEELVAELGAAFLCSDLALANEPRPDHAAYLSHWLAVLKADSRAVFTAARLASQAATHLRFGEPTF